MATTDSKSIRLALKASTPYNFSVDWGDGAVEYYNFTTGTTEAQRGVTHTYTTPGKYKVSITQNVVGGFPGLDNNNTGVTLLSYDAVKLKNVVQWGNNTLGGTTNDISRFFLNATTLQLPASDYIDAFSNIKIFNSAWSNCTSLTSFPALSTPAATSLDNTWAGCTSLTNFPSISCPNLVGEMKETWVFCSSLKTFPDISIPKVTSFMQTWANCSSLVSFPLIDTSNVTNMGARWQNGWGPWAQCTSLTSFPLLDTSKVTNLHAAWQNCISLTSFPTISTPAAISFNATWAGCTSLTSFPLLPDTSKVTDFTGTWAVCTSLSALPLLNLSAGRNFDRTWERCDRLSATGFPAFNTSTATSFEGAFQRLTGRDFSLSWLLLHPLTAIPSFMEIPSNTDKVTSFRNTWRGCGSISTFPSTFNVRSVTDVSGAWGNCISLSSFPNIMLSAVQFFGRDSVSDGYNLNPRNSSGFPVSDVWHNQDGAWMNCRFTSFPELCTQSGIQFNAAWYNCKSLTSFPFLDTGKGTNFTATWRCCSGIRDFPQLNFLSADNLKGAFSFMYSLTSFPPIDTRNCRYFGAAWNNCSNLITFPAINTVSATSLQFGSFGSIVDSSHLGGAWEGCISLTAFPFINTSNVTNFKYAWRNCRGLSASPFPTLNMSKMSKSTFAGFFDFNSHQNGTGGDRCFEGVTLQTQSWSALLTSLCATNFNTEVTFHGGNSKRNAAGTVAYDFLTSSIGSGGRAWTIQDAGPA